MRSGHLCMLLRLDPAISPGTTNGREKRCWTSTLQHLFFVVLNSQVCLYRPFIQHSNGRRKPKQHAPPAPHQGRPTTRYDEADLLVWERHIYMSWLRVSTVRIFIVVSNTQWGWSHSPYFTGEKREVPCENIPLKRTLRMSGCLRSPPGAQAILGFCSSSWALPVGLPLPILLSLLVFCLLPHLKYGSSCPFFSTIALPFLLGMYAERSDFQTCEFVYCQSSPSWSQTLCLFSSLLYSQRWHGTH